MQFKLCLKKKKKASLLVKDLQDVCLFSYDK